MHFYFSYLAEEAHAYINPSGKKWYRRIITIRQKKSILLTIIHLKCIHLKTYVVSRNADFELDQYPASKVIDVSHSQIESCHPIYSNEMHFSGNPLSA